MLIRTKLKVPSLRSRLLFRKDLVRRLCAAERDPFVLISGPAGSGKTSLACQWIKKGRFNAVWYSLDEEDNEPDLFYRYFLAAFIQSDESFNESLGPMLGSRQELTADIVIPHIIASLSMAKQKTHLILDDFHQIENERIFGAIARLMQYIPAKLQLVILSRYSLAAPIEAVVLKHDRLEITAEELKFTTGETEELFKKVIPGYISYDQILRVSRHLEGWAAGLQLIGLEVRSKGKQFDLSSIMNQAHEQVASYLIYDILRMQPENIRRFIFATALLDRFNPELCVEITGQKESLKLLARLEYMNLFLIPLDIQRKWYRYHHMFSEVVRRRISMDTPDLFPATLRKAALWFAANNYLEDAMRSAFQTGDFEFAADLMENLINQFMEQFDPMAGLRWIERLPPLILNQRPLLKLHQCNFLMILMDLSRLKLILRTIERSGNQALEMYSGAKRTLCEDYIIFLNCMLEILQAEQFEQFEEFETLSKRISPQNSFFSKAIETVLVSVLISKGDFTAAETLFTKVNNDLPFDKILKKVYLEKFKVLIARQRGQLQRAETLINQIQQEIAHQGFSNTPMKFILHRHLGHIYYLQNRLSEARECIDLAVRHCEQSGLVDEIMAGSELRLLLHLAAGERNEIAECFKVLRAYSIKLAIPRVVDSLDCLAAHIAIEQGNLASAVLWSQRRNIRMDETFSLLFAVECLTQARLSNAREKYTEAVCMLEYLRQRCLKRELLELILYIDILRCANFYLLNYPEKAKVTLMKALAFSEKEGYVRPYVNNARLIAPVLVNIAEDLPETSFTPHFESVFNACGIQHYHQRTSHEERDPMQENLTQREMEILKWMSQGAQNKEIAQKEFISINTVKTHVRSILAKLQVRTRTQAIIKAKEMHLHKIN